MKLSTHIQHCVQLMAMHGDGDVTLKQWVSLTAVDDKPAVVSHTSLARPGATYGIYPSLIGQFE